MARSMVQKNSTVKTVKFELDVTYGPADDMPDGLPPELLRFDAMVKLVDELKKTVPLNSNLRGTARVSVKSQV